ncbi:MAG: hypothetical protein K6U80_15635 [Firmicutes bacterium]|nr:hypothetical protein [Bacillota bacterium]
MFLSNLKTNGSLKNDSYLEKYLLTKEDVALSYEQTNMEIVLGYCCDEKKDLFYEKCLQDGVPINRRRGGGGTVLLSPGMIIMVIICEVRSFYDNLTYFSIINDYIIKTLKKLEVREVIQQKGVSDLVIGNKKILGSSIYRNGSLLFYQASLMVHNDLKLISKYLKMPNIAPEYRNSRNHDEFCANLAQFGYHIELQNIIDCFQAGSLDLLQSLKSETTSKKGAN